MACGSLYLNYLINKGALSVNTANLLDVGTQCFLGAEPADILRIWQSLTKPPRPKFSRTAAETLSHRSKTMGDPVIPTAYLSEVLAGTMVNYESLDVCPGEKTTIFDLNQESLPERWRDYFDLILNFGTTEHVFNQYNAFRVMHDAAKPGGYIFHQVPCSAYYDHCYFIYTPKFFDDLGRANNYQLADLWITSQGQHSIQAALTEPQRQLAEAASRENRDGNSGPSPSSGGTCMLINVLYRVGSKAAFKLPLELSTSHSPPAVKADSAAFSPRLSFSAHPAAASQSVSPSVARVPNELPVVNIVIPCWGEPYVSIFLRHALDSLCACIRHCRTQPEVHLWFYTSEKHRAAVSQALAAKSGLIRYTDIVGVDDLIASQPYAYQVMSKCHERAIQICPRGELILFIQPDTVWSVNTLQQCLDHHATGVGAIVVPSLRVALEELYAAAPHGVAGLDSSALVDVASRCLHPLIMAFFCPGPAPVNLSLGTYIRPVLNLGYVASYFHLHPLMIESPGRPVTIPTTIDHDLVYTLFEERHIRTVRDSSEIFALEISPRLHRQELITGESVATNTMAGWVKQWTCPQHRANACAPVRIFRSEYDGTDPTHLARFDAAEASLAREFSRLLNDLPYELVY